mgnify:CR=1 FL=1
MPDFEALIRHQQLKQPKTNQRLKVVDSPDLEKLNSEITEIRGSEIFKNLYFVGAGTHPGAGMPGVLSSAKVLDKLF